MGFTYIGCFASQLGAYFAIKCCRHENLLALLKAGIHDQLAVGRKAGSFIKVGIGEWVNLVGGQFHQMQLVLTAVA